MTRAANAIGAVQCALLTLLVLGAPDLTGGWPFLLFLLVTLVVGWVLAARMPSNPIGWLLLTVSGFFLLGLPAEYVGERFLEAGSSTAAAWFLWYGGERETQWVWLPPVGLLFTQVLLLFPDGRLPSRSWRPFWLFATASLVFGTVMFAMIDADVAPGLPNPIGWVDAENPRLAWAVFVPLLISFAGSAWSLVRRYRMASGVMREQIKWVAFAAGVVVGLYILTLTSGSDALQSVVTGSYSLIPLSIGVAVLKYRLYDIDRIVSRTVSYGLVSLAVVATYALVVTSASRLLPGSEALPVAGATLAAAAVFLPVLRWVRAAVDRRFDRERFDAQVEVEGFAARMATTVDSADVADDLQAAVRRTLAPTATAVWIATPVDARNR